MIYEYGPHPLLGDDILDHQFFWHLQDIHRQVSMNDGHMWSINLSMFFLFSKLRRDSKKWDSHLARALLYDLTTILMSRALHPVLSSVIKYVCLTLL